MIFSDCLHPPKHQLKHLTIFQGFAQAGNRHPLFEIVL